MRIVVALLAAATLQAQPLYKATPEKLDIQLVQGSPTPVTTAVLIAANPLTATFGVTVPTTASSWLSVSPATGTPNPQATIQISVSAASLGAGSYSANVTVTPASGGVALLIPVTLTVLSQASGGSLI